MNLQYEIGHESHLVCEKQQLRNLRDMESSLDISVRYTKKKLKIKKNEIFQFFGKGFLIFFEEI
jgi:hypothetical protein